VGGIAAVTQPPLSGGGAIGILVAAG
jgi:hypothetical protein